MNRFHKWIYIAAVLFAIGLAFYGYKKMTRPVRKDSQGPTSTRPTGLVKEVSKQSYLASNNDSMQTASTVLDNSKSSATYKQYEDPNLGTVELIKKEIVVVDSEENRNKYPQGFEYIGLWRVPILPGMEKPDDYMFLVKTKGGIKVASGLFSVKLTNYQADQDAILFAGAEIHKKRPEINVVVYKFKKFEDMLKAKEQSKNMTETVRSTIEIIDRPRGSN